MIYSDNKTHSWEILDYSEQKDLDSDKIFCRYTLRRISDGNIKFYGTYKDLNTRWFLDVLDYMETYDP